LAALLHGDAKGQGCFFLPLALLCRAGCYNRLQLCLRQSSGLR
jgi:hypothetical protein